MKKIIIVLSVTIILMAGLYLFFASNMNENDLAETVEISHLTREESKKQGEAEKEKVQKSSLSSVNPKETAKEELQAPAPQSRSFPKSLTEDEIEEIDEQLALYEENWDKETEELFLNNLKLSEEDYEDYLLMRDGFDEDRVEAFQEFHNRMAVEKGSTYSYSPTAEMVQNEERIREDYLKLFKERFGEEAYRKYFNLLEEYNDRIRREADPKNGVLRIDF